MKLRISSGTLRGRYLTIPQRDETFRPTRERVRESVADILMPKVAGSLVADVCAGSGGMGFELLSRGASGTVFVEPDRFRSRYIQEHAQKFGVADRCRVIGSDAGAFARACTDRFSIIYFDPPYDEAWGSTLLPLLARLLAAGGVLVYERRSSKGRESLAIDGMPEPFDRRVYGESEICFFTIEQG
jgi:16S rRNA (guanine966-N2)-methyltransferase